MENVTDPRTHINEEPRDDFGDVFMGFSVFFGFMFVVFAAAVVIKYIIT